MTKPAITRFSSLAVDPVKTNKNNGMYAPILNTKEIADIPVNTNGGIIYDEDVDQLKARVNGTWEPVAVGKGVGDVKGPNISIDGNIAVFDGVTGKIIKDSGAVVQKVNPEAAIAIKSAETLSFGAKSLDLDDVIELGNLGHIKFTNGAGFIFVDGDIPVGFTSVDFGSGDHVCSVFTGGLARPTSTVSALVEIHSSDGALLLSRMSTADRELLKVIPGAGSDGANGMLLFNTTTKAFNGFDGTNWREIALFNTNGDLDLNNHKILNVTIPTLVTDGANKGYVDAAVSGIPTATISLSGNVVGSGIVSSPIVTTLNMTLDQITAPAANLNLNSRKIVSLLNPTLAQDGATKNYVDTSITTALATTVLSVTGTAGRISSTGGQNPVIDFVNSAITGFRLDQFAVPASSINLNNQKIINLLDPTSAQEGSTKNYVDTRVITLTGAVTGAGSLGTTIATTLTNITISQISNLFTARLDQFAAPNVNLSLGNQKIINLLNPTLAQDGATKNYVDTSIAVPAAAKFIIQTTNASVPNAQVLGSLTTGLLKNTTTTGILSIAIAGTDYYSLGNPTRILDDGLTNFFTIFLDEASSTSSLLTTGNNNTTVGGGSGSSLTTGSFNSAHGALSLQLTTTGSFNNAFAFQAMRANQNGIQNSAFGTNSLTANTTGSFNASFGNLSGGNRAIYNNCSFFGFGADASINNLTNAIAIGYLASVSADNCMVLGGSGANQLSVGIGITPSLTCQFQLPTIHSNRKIVLYETANNDHQVYGFGTASSAGIGVFRFQIDATTSNYTFNAGVNSTTSNELMRLTGGGFLGIGTASPNAPLHFAGVAANRKIILFEFGINNDHQFYGFGVNNGILRYQIPSIIDNHVFYCGSSISTSNELMRLNGNGNLLLGTTSEVARIHVVQGIVNVASEYSCIRVSSLDSFASKIELSAASLWELRSEGAIGAGNFSIYNRSASSYGLIIGPVFSVAKQSSATYYGTAATNTTVATAGTFVKLNWPPAISTTFNNYTYATSRLTYSSGGTAVPIINQTINITITAGHNGATAGEIATFALYKNGILIATSRDTITAITVASGTIYSIKTVPITKCTTVSSTDFFEIFVTNSVARIITVTDFSFSISST